LITTDESRVQSEPLNGRRAILSTVVPSEKDKSEKPKVVRIIARLTVGGPARQVCLLHEELVPHFDTRLVIGSLAAGEEDMSYLLSSEENVVRLPQMSREISAWSDAVSLWRMFRLLRKERPAIVHTHTAKAGAVGRIAAWLAGVPIIVHTYHGNIFHGYFSPLKTRAFLTIERLLSRISTQVIAISDSQFREICVQYRAVPKEKVSVVHNGFDLTRFSHGCRDESRKMLGLSPDAFVVAWAGRMVPVKDVQLLAQVIKKAGAEGRKIYFLLVGDGTQKKELENQIRGCSNFRLLGWQQEMETIWPAADMALLTSRNEGTPTALIEAMAAGLPFVATNVGGVQDLATGAMRELPDGMGFKSSNGFLTARTADALLYCIDKIQKNPQMRKEMAAAGREFVFEKFCARRLVQELNLLYQTLITKRQPLEVAGVPERSEGRASEAGDAI